MFSDIKVVAVLAIYIVSVSSAGNVFLSHSSNTVTVNRSLHSLPPANTIDNELSARYLEINKLTRNQAWGREEAAMKNFTQLYSNRQNNRRQKLISALSPFTVVRWLMDTCSAGGYTGTCVGLFRCINQGGFFFNMCAEGLGVCCVAIAPENGVIAANNTLLKRTGFSKGDDVMYTVKKMNDDICQFRLDVRNLRLSPTPVNGICSQDFFSVDQDTKFGRICGITRDVHYYIDVTASQAKFTFHTESDVILSREWEIYVQQIPCDSKAPTGCGQWYLGETGTIQLWGNIDQGSDCQYIDDQEYGICIRMEAGFCTVTYSEMQLFYPVCGDVLERPSFFSAGDNPEACLISPLTDSKTYVVASGQQIFQVRFKDSTNLHHTAGDNSRKFKAVFTQNRC